MSDCIFCKIVKNEIPSTKVWEDDKFLAFLNINPVTDGHLLLIPKEHHVMMTDVPDKLLSEIYIKAKKLMKAVKKAMGADYVVLSVEGTEVPHFHIHLIPRKFDDALPEFWVTKKYAAGIIVEIGQKIRKVL